MSYSTYTLGVALSDKPLVWLQSEIQSPPFSKNARIEAGYLLRRLQKGETLSLPYSRPMPSIGQRVHELRIRDQDRIWRIVYRIDEDAIILAEVFSKKTRKTPGKVIDTVQNRLRAFDRLVGE
jgi:phage-related protein